MAAVGAYLVAEAGELEPRLAHDARRDAILLQHEPQQQVLGADAVMAE